MTIDRVEETVKELKARVENLEYENDRLKTEVESLKEAINEVLRRQE
jgi:chaperonin cofactor prefoldin